MTSHFHRLSKLTYALGRRSALQGQLHSSNFHGIRFFSSLPPHSKLAMPALSPTMEEGNIAAWTKSVGDFVGAGESVCEIETDKATVDFEMADDGFLAKILVPAKADSGSSTPIKVGTTIGIIVEEAEDVAAFENYVEEASAAAPVSAPEPAAPTETAKDSIPAAAAPISQPASTSERIKISPFAKKTAAENGLTAADLAKVQGTGLDGRIIAANVKSLAPSAIVAEPVPETPLEHEGTALSADGLTQLLIDGKKNIPHYFLNSHVDVTDLLKLQKEFNGTFDIALNDFILKAAALSMKLVPGMNSSFKDGFIREYTNVHVNVYKRSESGTSLGLVKEVNSKGLGEIAEAGKLIEETDGDVELGTFSVLDLGAFGVSSVNPIIMDGQAGCLGVGTVTQELTVAGDGEYENRSKLWVSLSCDHRVVDGAVGAVWMQNFKKLLENPKLMLL